MFRKIFIFVLIALVSAANPPPCTANQVYLKAVKKSTGYSSEETYRIKNGEEIINSPILADDEVRESEFCIGQSTDLQYVLEMADSASDSWSLGTYLEIRGVYGNIAYKNYMTEKVLETATVSLYTPIMKVSAWKMTGSVSGTWTSVVYTETDWTDIITGSVVNPAIGPQYFRKTFNGIEGMVAYEVKMNFRYGIVAYVNGVEIYRDNMDPGVVVSSTLAKGSYEVVDFRGVIRPTNEIATSSVLAVELHYMSANANNTVDFDAFLAEYAPTVSEAPCFVVGTVPTITSTLSSPTNVADYSRNSFSYMDVSMSSGVVPHINYIYTPNTVPCVNAFRIWPSTDLVNVPKTIIFEGTNEDTYTGTYNELVKSENMIFQTNTHKYIYSYFNKYPYKNYRATVTLTGTDYLYIYEMHPLVCKVETPSTIEFKQTSYSYIVNYNAVNIRPILLSFTSCTIAPLPLPAGLSLNPTTCTLSGTPTVAVSQTTFTLSSVVGTNQYSGTFLFTATECAGTMMEFQKINKYNAAKEGYIVKDTATDTVILSVIPNSGQTNYVDVSYPICITADRLSIDISCTDATWVSDSYLFIKTFVSSSEKETHLRIRFDNTLGLPAKFYVNSASSIRVMSQWYYKMSEVPTDWYNSVTTGWTEAATGSFPEPSNRIQLYKKTFTIASLANVAGYTVTMKYQYGCVIYMNGVEVFRNGVAAGPVTTTSEVNNFYNDITFHTVSLPARTMTIGTTTGAAILIQGSNTIAIALVAMSDTQKTVVFDATVHLMGENEVSRVFDYDATTIGSNNPAGAFDNSCSTYYAQSSCGPNTLTLSFKNDRREWISSIVIQNMYNSLAFNPVQFVLEAHNYGEEWHTLKTVEKLSWSLIGQKKKIWIMNNNSYNQYRFSNFADGKEVSCYWKVNRIDMFSDNLSVDIPVLTYASPPIFKNIEMAEAYPSSNFYTDFVVTPNLPAGLVMDPQVGVISGTAASSSDERDYNVSAKKATGESVSVVLKLAVMVCSGVHSLITVVVRSDSYNSESSVRLFKGKSNSGQLVIEYAALPAKSAFIYIDNCLDNGLYFFEAKDKYGDGWIDPAGYTMSVDVGAMYFDMNMVPNILPTKPSVISTIFSSYMPFQMEYTDWKVYKLDNAVATNWKDISIDESNWITTKLNAIEVSQSTTVYARKVFDIPNLDDYSVLNVRVKYTGGIVAYFNGKKVARFNLIEEFTSSTQSIALHDASISSKFHILLAIDGAVQGNNVLAVEIHRPFEGSSATPVVFDMTGVFGVNACSPVLDTFSSLTTAVPISGESIYLFDLFPYNTCILPNSVDTHVEWIVDNLEGSRFNSYGIFLSSDVTGWGLTLSGRNTEMEEWLAVSEVANQSVKSRVLPSFDASPSIAGFNSYKWDVDTIASDLPVINSFVFSYCKASGSICTGSDGYPTVGEGQISPSTCNPGYRGYMYKVCTNGVFSEAKDDKCKQKAPENLHYVMSTFKLVRDVVWNSEKPVYDNIIENYIIDKGTLPAGLILDANTGIISGSPTEISDLVFVEIRGQNHESSVKVEIGFSVRLGECKAEGMFITTQVGKIATYECSSQGLYIGTQSRPCILGAKDGEWQKASGFCMSVFLLVSIIVIVIVIIVIIVFIIVRVGRKSKAVGGVKGKNKKVSVVKNNKKSVKAVVV